MSLPTIRSVPNTLQCIHQSILAEMGNAGETVSEGDVIPEVLIPQDSVAESHDSGQSDFIHVSVQPFVGV